MDNKAIQEKFGDQYFADKNTFTMGIDLRFTTHFAERFKELNVLETCTGAGFTTISLARTAKHVYTVEIDPCHQHQAVANVKKAGLSQKVSFIQGNILDPNVLANFAPVDAAFLDPDWAVTGPQHKYRFIHSNTQPPADILLEQMFKITGHIALVLPPYVNEQEFNHLPAHELEKLYLDRSHELYCIYFGQLMKFKGESEFRVES